MTITIDYIDGDKLTKNDKFNLENKTKKLAKQFEDNKQEIELVEPVVNQERSTAIKAYKELVEQCKRQSTHINYTTELFHL